METLIYFFIFIIGTLFGSFFTLAVYRIPIKQSIMKGRSYCPKCNHRLEFLDLIPVLSYIFLGGKCRYCKEKIRPRYLIIELLSGITFLAFALSLEIKLYNLEVNKLVYLGFGMLYLSTLFIMAGIEKEKHSISKPVLLFGLIALTTYIIYLYIIGISIYKYVIYLFLIILLYFTNSIILKKKNNYSIQILTLCFYFSIFVREETVILSIILTIFLIIIKQINIAKKTSNKAKSESNNTIPIGFYLCVSNIITLILQNYII